jgi:hypothetical protein
MRAPASFAARDAGLSKASYTRLENKTRRVIGAISEQLDKGTISRDVAFRLVSTKLQEAIPEAFRLGKAVGWGSRHHPVILTPAEYQRTRAISGEQCARLRAWLLAPGPLVRPGVQRIGPRLDMYALSLHGAYQTGLAFGLLQAASGQKGMSLYEDDPIWLWERSTDPGVCACKDCIAREQRSLAQPYTLVELLTIGFPATGGTRCLTRCRCRVRIIDDSGSQILTKRAHHRAKSTAYHGVVDPRTVKDKRINVVGSR